MRDFDFVNAISMFAGIIDANVQDVSNVGNLARALFLLGNHRDALVAYRFFYKLVAKQTEDPLAFVDENASKSLFPYISKETRVAYQEHIELLRPFLETVDELGFDDVLKFWRLAFRPERVLANVMDWDIISVGMCADPENREGRDGNWGRKQLAVDVHSRGRSRMRSGYLYLALRYFFYRL